ncbi:MAG: hydrogenase maturation nickel metallochaperone HypA [Proteobacteria bacterium]|nr:hydrogenase maturation nickel metallochaperone HypA [Pseudomonadota bacterium]
MHELSLVNSLLEIVDDYARRESFIKVNCLHLPMGSLYCIDRASLQFAFDVQAQGTIAEGALLAIEVHPAVVYCFACGGETRQDRFEPDCPKCGSSQVTLTGGTEELRLIDMDVE